MKGLLQQKRHRRRRHWDPRLDWARHSRSRLRRWFQGLEDGVHGLLVRQVAAQSRQSMSSEEITPLPELDEAVVEELEGVELLWLPLDFPASLLPGPEIGGAPLKSGYWSTMASAICSKRSDC